jgi:hypothetical protein
MRTITPGDRDFAKRAYEDAVAGAPEGPLRAFEALESGLQTLLTRVATAAADEARLSELHSAGSEWLKAVRTLCAGRAQQPELLFAVVDTIGAAASVFQGLGVPAEWREWPAMHAVKTTKPAGA